MFENISEAEMQDIEGGGLTALEIAAGVVGIYMCIRELFRDAGRRAAYEELGY